MKPHEELRRSPEYLEWLEQELIKHIIKSKRLITELGEAASDIDYVIRNHGSTMEVDFVEDLKGIITMITKAMEA